MYKENHPRKKKRTSTAKATTQEPVYKHDVRPSSLDAILYLISPMDSFLANGNLNHLGIRRAPSKSTVAYQNAKKGQWRVPTDILCTAYSFWTAGGMVTRPGFRFKMPIKLLDSSTITLTMSLYEWAHYTTRKGRGEDAYIA